MRHIDISQNHSSPEVCNNFLYETQKIFQPSKSCNWYSYLLIVKKFGHTKRGRYKELLNSNAKPLKFLKVAQNCSDYYQTLTCDKRQRRESTWFLATESPMKAIFLPRTMWRKVLGSNLGRSHCSGFHFQLRKSVSTLPCLKQFLLSGIVVQLELV